MQSIIAVLLYAVPAKIGLLNSQSYTTNADQKCLKNGYNSLEFKIWKLYNRLPGIINKNLTIITFSPL